MSNTHKPKTIVCEEVFDEFSAPSEEEVIDYAKKIGIDPKCEAHLLPIARNGLMQPLPPEWKPCYDSAVRRWYYYNTETTKSQWEHPLDNVYRQLVKRGRSEGYSSAADDDLKTTAKEDLKSFEEVSDILSSKSNDIKIEEDSAEMAEKSRTHQPLLLRRKQLQSGGDSIALQVAKVMNNTMKENSLAEFEKFNQASIHSTSFRSSEATSRSVNTTPVTPKQLQPLRRAQTLDPIPLTSSHTKHLEVPIKGILRESSFSGLQNRNLARSNPMQGELPTRTLEMEDEKKRSVRFADFERKSLDIRFQFSDSEDSLSDEDVETGSSSPEIAASDGQSPEEGVNTEINIEKKQVDNKKANPDDMNTVDSQIIEPIDPNKIKNKLLSRQAIVAPLKIDSIGNGSDYDESQSSFGKGSLSVNSGKFSNRSEIPCSFPVKEITTSRFTVKAVPEDSNNLPLKKVIENLDTTSIRYDNIPSNVQQNIADTAKSVKDGEKIESYDVIPKEIEEMARKKASEKLAVFEEKLTKEVQEKISYLKKQQNDTLTEIKENLIKFEEDEKNRLKQESECKLAELKVSLEEEFKKKELEIRASNEKAVQELMNNLEVDRNKFMNDSRTNHELILSKCKQEEEEKLNEEKRKLDADFELEIQKRKETLQSKLDLIKEEEEAQLNLIKQENETKLQQLEEKYKNITIKEEQKFQTDIKKMEEEFTTKLTQLKAEKESELRRVQTEWEDKITATTLQHKTTLESAMIDHENSMAALRNQFQHEEDDLKKYHAEQIEAWNIRLKKLLEKEPSSVGQINRDFEKMRCEKRLIEDKYRSLKDKYLQLKTDMKVAVERKLQSRARRKREIQGLEKDIQEEKDTIRNERSKNNNSEDAVYNDKSPQPTKLTPRIVEPFPVFKDTAKELADNDPSSDDQYVSTSLSSTFPTDIDQKNVIMNRAEADRRRKHSKAKGKIEKCKDRQGNVLDDVKSQLQELEEIEEQIPANSQGETYLRYPFHGPGLSTTAEVDFYRHRVIVEQEAVRAARECLLQQKRELEARQNILRTNNNTSTMQQLQQQERDLTEMEVSLHRTRALLGEKMIRLRLLGQTLNRLVDDTPTNFNGASGDPQLKQGNMISAFPNETVPFNVLQNLENINSEIREIWSQLSKQQIEGSSGAAEESTQVSYKPVAGAAKAATKSFRRAPSSRAEIEARIQGLREWLQKPQQSNSDWNQLTL